MTVFFQKFTNALSNMAGSASNLTAMKVTFIGGIIWIFFIVIGVVLFVAAAAVHIGLIVILLFGVWFLLTKVRPGRLSGALKGLPASLISDVSAHIHSNSDVELIQGRAHNNILLKAFNEAKVCIVILSGCSLPYDVHPDLERKIEAALKRGVNVYVGYGKVSAAKHRNRQSTDKKSHVKDNNNQNSGWRRNYTIQELSIEGNLLIVDGAYAAFGAHNWLSAADLSSLDQSWIITDELLVHKLLSSTMDLFNSHATVNS